MGVAGIRKLDVLCDAAPTARPQTGGEIPVATLGFLDAFHRKQISYCYWKSSRRLASVLAGDGDLDLLVAREDQHRAEAVLLENGFKRFHSVANRDHPSIASFLGYDEPTDRLVHVHAHFRLVLGERLLKNYCPPWEKLVLARAVHHPTLPIRILDPESEALLWVVRVCLELRKVDPLVLRDWEATKRKFATDRRELVTRVNRAGLHQLAAQLLGEELAELVCDSLDSERILESPGRLRPRILAYLAAHRTYNAFEARLRVAGRTMFWLAGNLNKRLFHVPRPWNRRVPGGGCVVALIGVDGCGKTTVGSAVRTWLGSEIDVIPIYFGTGGGRPSLFLRPLKLMVPPIQRLFKRKPQGSSHGEISNDAPSRLYAGLLMVWAAFVALEKRGKLLVAQRGANRGLVVLTDRYPQNEIVGFNDGPLLGRLKRVPLWLRRFEADTYALAHRLPPNLVIKLEATAETIARREPDMDQTVIRERTSAVARLGFPGARVVCANAEQPLEQVIRAVKREIWQLL